MKIWDFFENFRTLMVAPNGLTKMRELILSLAFQGKLIEQEPHNLPAVTLIQKIESEKHRLSKELGLKTSKPQLEIRQDEIPHKIPENWEWVRFGNIAQHNSGKTLDKRRNTGLPREYITTSNLYWGTFELNNLKQMLIKDEELEKCTAAMGDLLICEGGEAGRAAVWPYKDEICFQNHIHRARFYYGVNPYFAYRFFEKLNFTGELNQYRKGVGISSMSGKTLASIVFPLAPAAEQKRIVAKVDELMAICDKLEAQQQQKTKLFPVLSRAAHARFVESPTMENLKAIFDEADNVSPEDLRKTVLSLAVQGKLVEQDENDGHAETIFKNSNAAYVNVHIDNQRYPIPDSWVWSYFKYVGDQRLGKMLDKTKNRGVEKPYLRNTNVQWNRFDLSDIKLMKIEEREKSELALHPGDLLICEGGEPGRCAIWNSNQEMYFQKALHRVRPVNGILPEYLSINLNIDCQNEVLSELFTGATIKHLTGKSLRKYSIPIPPTTEQYKIVAKVEQFMTLIDQLEQQQTQKSKVAEAFAKASVSAITGSDIKEQEKMRAPKTELVTKLQIDQKPNESDNAPLAKLLAAENGGTSAKMLWQQSGLEIDAFYRQLKNEMANGWIIEPEKAEMKVVKED